MRCDYNYYVILQMNGASLVIKEFQAPSMHSFSTDEQRFMDEARMVMKLNHRNIVRAIDLPEQTFSRRIENLHLCMEYCEGGDLRNVRNTYVHSLCTYIHTLMQLSQCFVSAYVWMCTYMRMYIHACILVRG